MDSSCEMMHNFLKRFYKSNNNIASNDNDKKIKAAISMLLVLNEFSYDPLVRELLKIYELFRINLESRENYDIQLQKIEASVLKFFSLNYNSLYHKFAEEESKRNSTSLYDLLPNFLAQFFILEYNLRDRLTLADFLELINNLKLIRVDKNVYKWIIMKTIENNENPQIIHTENLCKIFSSIYGKGFKFFKALSLAYPINQDHADNHFAKRILISKGDWQQLKTEPNISTRRDDSDYISYKSNWNSVIAIGDHNFCDIKNPEKPCKKKKDKLLAIMQIENHQLFIKDCSFKYDVSIKLSPNCPYKLFPGIIIKLGSAFVFTILSITFQENQNSIIELLQIHDNALEIPHRFTAKKSNCVYKFGKSGYSIAYPIRGDKWISRKHAQLEYKDWEWFITDLNSKYGTFILLKTYQEYINKNISQPFRLFSVNSQKETLNIGGNLLNIEIINE